MQQIIFPNDFDFEQKILQEEKDRDSETLNNLVKDLIKLENYMREMVLLREVLQLMY